MEHPATTPVSLEDLREVARQHVNELMVALLVSGVVIAVTVLLVIYGHGPAA